MHFKRTMCTKTSFSFLSHFSLSLSPSSLIFLLFLNEGSVVIPLFFSFSTHISFLSHERKKNEKMKNLEKYGKEGKKKRPPQDESRNPFVFFPQKKIENKTLGGGGGERENRKSEEILEISRLQWKISRGSDESREEERERERERERDAECNNCIVQNERLGFPST